MQWDTARDEDTVESYARFVSLFPDSEHAAEARTLEVTRAWARAAARAAGELTQLPSPRPPAVGERPAVPAAPPKVPEFLWVQGVPK